MANSKSLIAYFSRKGNNYVGGSIVNLPIGNTEVVANKIQKLTRGDIFQIRTVKSYPEDYTETTNVAREEQRENARPELTEIVDNTGSYAVIYIGYPNWYGTMPMPVFTFLSEYNFSGKPLPHFARMREAGSAVVKKTLQSFARKQPL